MTFGSVLTQTFTTPKWNPKTGLPDLTGKIAIVTGASTGLGKETALNLSSKGAHVFCVGRSAEKTQAAVADIISKSGNTNVEFLQADLMDLASVESAADTFLARNLPLHILVNNAGIMESPWGLSKEGIETQFATNHFAHVVLTAKLLPVLEKSQPSRIVILSSMSHYANLSSQKGGIKYVTSWEQDKYDAFTRYGETKLANLHFARELQSRLDAKLGVDSKIYVNAVHPGIVRTELQRTMNPTAASVIQPILISAEKGALTQTYVAASEDIEKQNLKAKYFVPYCKVAEISADAQDKTQAVNTWEWTEKILKQQYKPDWTFGL
ncbi:hypothetical protein HK100_009974 [Physocladia obscura]|uniref:Uncharacterized protein n=1 Tax=Physocladia obscura TaxID=109957 RepID=A0AAD5T5I9_9FUNG|nr:hypothetical protein HK100_009974 [Physocladia obscura]